MGVEMVLLVYVVGILTCVYPLHHFSDVYSGLVAESQEKSLKSGELTHSHMLPLFDITHKNKQKINIKLNKFSKANTEATGQIHAL